MSWNFKREEQQFTPIPEGDYRIRIKDADKAVSSNGNDMLVLKFEVSGKKSLLFHNIVFLNDRPEITNRMLTRFFDSFKDIPEGDFNMANWIGKVGAAHVFHEEYNGEVRAKIKYFIDAKKQDTLAPWQEPDNAGSGSSDGAFIDTSKAIEDAKDLPFF